MIIKEMFIRVICLLSLGVFENLGRKSHSVSGQSVGCSQDFIAKKLWHKVAA